MAVPAPFVPITASDQLKTRRETESVCIIVIANREENYSIAINQIHNVRNIAEPCRKPVQMRGGRTQQIFVDELAMEQVVIGYAVKDDFVSSGCDTRCCTSIP